MSAVNLDFEGLTKGLSTKSDKIRILGRAGASTGEIARYLGIRYQFARNVLVDAGLRGNQPAATPAEAQTPADHADGWLKVATDGTLVLPASWVSELGLKAGDAVLVRKGDDCLEVLSQVAGLARARRLVSQYVPSSASLVDELLADRKAAAEEEKH